MSFLFHYQTSGAGIPFVFQHGLGGNLEQAQNLLAGLENVRLISMDCRGHGKTPFDPAFPPSFNQYADDLVGLLDHLGIGQAIAGGISMGAGIALNLAVRYPHRVLALVLVRPAWLDRPDPPNLMILSDLADFAGLPAGWERFQSTPAFLDLQKELPNAAQSVLGQFSREQGEYTPAVLKQMVQDAPVSDLNLLESVRQPCLILAGEQDPLHPLEFGRTLNSRLPQSRLERVDSRYLDEAVHAGQVRKYVTEFIKRCTRLNMGYSAGIYMKRMREN